MSESYQLAKGRILGRNYKVLEFLGSGWEGEVYKVEEVHTGIVRAAKLFYTHQSEKPKPHVHYAKKLYSLRHCPIVIQYHSYDKTLIKKQSVDFLISEFADGVVLAQFIKMHKRKRLTYFEAMHLFYALVQGVEQIHAAGEYHGDIHTENIMIKRVGLGFDIKLIDFIHLGRSTKAKIQDDVVDLMHVLYEMIGGVKSYKNAPENFKRLICGKRKQAIKAKFPEAGYVRLFLENLTW